MACDKHGYTACVCPVCDEIEDLRAQVANKEKLLDESQVQARVTMAGWDTCQARRKEYMKKIELAYGWLWHSFSDDARVHSARRALADVLKRESRLAGIEASKAAGATVDSSDVIDKARSHD